MKRHALRTRNVGRELNSFGNITGAALLRKAAPGKAIIMQTNSIFRFAPLAVLTLLSGTAQAQQPAYTFQDLGTLGGGSASANAVNNHGEVVGYSTTADGRTRPFLYSNGVMRDLGTLYSPFTVGYIPADRGYATGLNDNGEVVGTTFKYTNANKLITVGFRYRNGTMTEFDSGATAAINNAGQSVGQNASGHASLYTNGVDTDLGILGGNYSIPGFYNFSKSYSINNSGQSVGVSSTSPNGDNHAFIYQNSKMQDLGLANGYTGAEAHAISDSGVVAGAVGKPDGTQFGLAHAVLWQNGQALDLGTLGGKNSTAYGVNSAGVVVGDSELALSRNGLFQSAFIYENGAMYDLFAGSDWYNANASAINEAGQIVGTGIHNGGIHAFLATPTAVPEPGSLLTCDAGIGILLLAARRRKRNAPAR